MNYMNNYSFIISSRKNKHNQKKVFKAVDLKKNEETRYKREFPPPHFTCTSMSKVCQLILFSLFSLKTKLILKIFIVSFFLRIYILKSILNIHFWTYIEIRFRQLIVKFGISNKTLGYFFNLYYITLAICEPKNLALNYFTLLISNLSNTSLDKYF